MNSEDIKSHRLYPYVSTRFRVHEDMGSYKVQVRTILWLWLTLEVFPKQTIRNGETWSNPFAKSLANRCLAVKIEESIKRRDYLKMEGFYER